MLSPAVIVSEQIADLERVKRDLISIRDRAIKDTQDAAADAIACGAIPGRSGYTPDEAAACLRDLYADLIGPVDKQLEDLRVRR